MNKKYLPSALILYLNYFIHGVDAPSWARQSSKRLWQQLGEWKQWQLPQFPQHSVLAV